MTRTERLSPPYLDEAAIQTRPAASWLATK